MGVGFFPSLPFMGVMLFPSFVLGNVFWRGRCVSCISFSIFCFSFSSSFPSPLLHLHLFFHLSFSLSLSFRINFFHPFFSFSSFPPLSSPSPSFPPLSFPSLSFPSPSFHSVFLLCLFFFLGNCSYCVLPRCRR